MFIVTHILKTATNECMSAYLTTWHLQKIKPWKITEKFRNKKLFDDMLNHLTFTCPHF